MVATWFVALLLVVRSALADPEQTDRGVPVYDFSGIESAVVFPREGPWALYRDKLVDEAPAGVAVDRIPGQVRWNMYELADGTRLPALGCHTYHARVRLPSAWLDARTSLAVSFPYQFHASRIVVRNLGPTGGRFEATSGTPGCSAEDELPLHRPVRRAFIADGDIEVFIQVSNFHAMRGGLVRAPFIGLAQAVEKDRSNQERADFFIFGVLGVTAIYHLAQWLLRRAQTQTLYFALLCFDMALRTVVFGNYLEAMEPPLMGFALSQRLVYLTIDGAVFFTIAFLNASLPKTLPPWMVPAFGIACGIVSTLVLVLDVTTFGPLIFVSQALVAIGSVILIGSCIRTAFRDRSVHALLMLASFLVLAATAVWDLVMDHFRLGQFFIAPYGTMGFVLIQAFAIALQNARARAEGDRLSISLASRSERLLQIDALKNEFLATTSHELRTPLNGIIGLSETLLQRSSVRGDREVTNHLLAIADAGRRLTGLIDDILDYSKLRTRKLALDVKPVDLRRVADQVMLLSRSLPGTRSIDLRESIPHDLPAVSGDENRLRQVLQNLVGNAIKFTERGFVEVTASVAGGFVEVRVRDSGIGIPADKFATIFETFEQLDSGPTRTAQGTGLGLAITRQLVELHGGAINVHSAVGLGSTFVFTVPVAKGAASLMPYSGASVASDPPAVPLDVVADHAEQAAAPRHQARWNILSVDDDVANLLVLRAQLDAREFNVTAVRDPRDAVRTFREQGPFDAVLLDVMMPKISGLEVARELRRITPLARCPIIFLSARTALDDFAAAFGAGGSDFLTKPVVRVELLTRLRHHLHVTAAFRESDRPLDERVVAFLNESEAPCVVRALRLPDRELRAARITEIVAAVAQAGGVAVRVSDNVVVALAREFDTAIVDATRRSLEAIVGDTFRIVVTIGPLRLAQGIDPTNPGLLMTGDALDEAIRALHTDS